MARDTKASVESSATPPGRDFSDLIQGEDLEFRESDRSNFPITHKLEALGHVKPPRFIQDLSQTQLVSIAGAASGFLAGVVVCPLDVVKTRLQAQGAMQKNILLKKFLSAFKEIFRTEGVKGLYRGLVPITIGYLPTWTIYFTIYERAKTFYPTFLRQNLGIQLDWANHFCSALTAGMASSIAVNPIWVVKTRLMIQTSSKTPLHTDRTFYKGTFDALKTMYKEEGFLVFYSGLVPSLFGLFHVGIHFPVFEHLKYLLRCNEPDTNHRLWRLIFALAVSKMIASTITYPHEILRTRLQIQAADHKRETLLAAVSKIYRKEHFKGFYAGYAINLMRTVPASAVTLVSFEYFKTFLLDISSKSKLQPHD